MKSLYAANNATIVVVLIPAEANIPASILTFGEIFCGAYNGINKIGSSELRYLR